jgi:hypothetical protein
LVESRKKIIICLIIAILLTLWLLPIYSDGLSEVMLKNGPVDGSMKIGFNWLSSLDLKFGKDIVFTYGPLFFLANNYVLSFNEPIIILANIFNIILWFLALFLLSLNIAKRMDFRDSKAKIVSHTVLIAAFISILNIFIGLSEVLLLTSFLILFNVLEDEATNKIKYFWLVAASFFLSIISLIKFVYFVISIAFILIAIIVFLIAKKYLHLAPLIAGYVFFYLLFWVLLQKSLSWLFLYIKNSLLITFGYSENVQRFGTGLQAKFDLLFVVLIFLLWLGILIYGIIKKNKSIIFYFLLSFPVLFLIYKQGFMRADYFHTQEYFRFVIYLLIFTILIFGKRLWKIFPIFLILFILALPFRSAYDTYSIREQLDNNKRALIAAERIFFPWKADVEKTKIIEDKKKLKQDNPIGNNLISKIKDNETVDIFSYEVYQLYINDLNWSPRPVFQSYNAYNPSLDEMNASHFRGINAPDKIIYRILGIDDRYAIYDEPKVFIELLKNYDFVDYDSNEFGLLEKRKTGVNFEQEAISREVGEIGSKITVPDVKDGYLFCKLDIDQSLSGKLKNLIYKGDFIFVRFYFKDKNIEPVVNRFVRANATSGVYISNYIGNIQDLSDTFKQKDNYKQLSNLIDSIEILTSNDSSFVRNFNVEFFELKFPDK